MYICVCNYFIKLNIQICIIFGWVYDTRVRFTLSVLESSADPVNEMCHKFEAKEIPGWFSGNQSGAGIVAGENGWKSKENSTRYKSKKEPGGREHQIIRCAIKQPPSRTPKYELRTGKQSLRENAFSRLPARGNSRQVSKHDILKETSFYPFTGTFRSFYITFFLYTYILCISEICSDFYYLF